MSPQEKMAQLETPVVKEDDEDIMDRVKREQAFNERLINLPKVFNIADRKIELKSLTFKEMIKKSGKLLDVQDRLQQLLDESDKTKEKREKEVEAAGDKGIDAKTRGKYNREDFVWMGKYNDLCIERLFVIINKDLETPEFDKEWISDNITVGGEDSDGVKILKSYNELSTPLPFLQESYRTQMMIL